ncbi:N-acetylmuramate alpha-1-phosphate uridylyltransferase MurU [Halomonas binhaiensis]|uniref:Nucleotidyltransferase family protein n=1 Tax=Halomonas binhaiensis TaxID=2562282 RepID=A0A5C1NCN6_9GAMM|nr:nucleotidyltransferase family protein [Halomonas binhaiensis]QEM80731.1 nucleotidyltransferase family protein [Halomonas binhaiensis]
MKAMILAAGLGTRMRPLTDHCPKPLLPVAGKPLIVHHLERLAASGIRQIVINVSYRAEQIISALGDGSRYGVELAFSHEEQPLETAGGIAKARPLLGDSPFLLINGDIWTDLVLSSLPQLGNDLAHLVLVDNPPQHPDGDFYLDDSGRVHAQGERTLTYAGIALIAPSLVDDLPEPCYPLAPLLRQAMRQQRVGGTHHRGHWVDVGTPQRLQELDAQLRTN